MAGRIARAGRDVPILGVNFGSLGFLTEITLPSSTTRSRRCSTGAPMIEARRCSRRAPPATTQPFADHIVLNDIVITKGALSRIIEISVIVGDPPVTRVRADGLIIASPTARPPTTSRPAGRSSTLRSTRCC